ncbi:MAG: hypothetical protein WEE64_08390 [Dehalococcoidia bacterium]
MLFALAAAGALLAFALVLRDERPAHSSPPPAMRLDPNPIKVQGETGQLFTIDVVIDGANDLGAFEFQFLFNTNFVKMAGYTEGPFLGSTGRPVSCLPATVNPGFLELGCNTTGGAPPGPSGAGVLASIDLFVQGLSFGETSLLLQSCQAADVLGGALVDGICKNAKLTINPPPTATATPTATPTPVPHNLKLPALKNLFLTAQGAKLPPATCAQSTDVAVFTHELDFAPVSLDPKDPSQVQRIGAYEFDVLYNPSYVCMNLEPGQYAVQSGMVCMIDDKNQGLQMFGRARIGCTTTGKNPPPSSSLELARLVVRPQPELYSLLRPFQENGVVLQIMNVGCNLADLQGHPILKSGCDDSDLTIRYLEGDANADCMVDIGDQQILAFRWGAKLGNLLYNSRFDFEPSGQINGDGDIDVKDVQFVNGRHGSTCDDPHPPQPPVNPKFPNGTPPPTPTPSPTPTQTRTPTPTPPNPRINKTPAKLDLALTTPPPAGPCVNGPDSVTFQMQVKDPIQSIDPKDPQALQLLGAFEFELSFDPAVVCVQVAPGALAANMICFTNNVVPGTIHYGCVSQGKVPVPPQPPGVLALITVRPQPGTYGAVTPGGPPLVTQLVNDACNLSDLQGHPIKSQGCGDATVNISYP